MKLFNNPRLIEDISIKLRDYLEEIKRIVEKNPLSEFEEITVTFPSVADTELRINLASLNRTPLAYQVVKADRAVSVYTGDTDWARNEIYLKANVASAVITLHIT